MIAESNPCAYTSRTGLLSLRNLIARELTATHQGLIGGEQVLVAAGGEQAFSAITSALTEFGDEVILLTPYSSITTLGYDATNWYPPTYIQGSASFLKPRQWKPP
ncbi:hypothetical protein ACWEJ6_53640 [Nonomuraea sp. NPDC004702]